MNLPQIFFGTLREHYIMLFSFAGGVALLAGFVGAWIGSYFGGRRSAGAVVKEIGREVADSPQFQQMMQAIDVLSVEVERLSEGQRFVAKHLSERAERERIAAFPARERKSEHITPH